MFKNSNDAKEFIWKVTKLLKQNNIAFFYVCLFDNNLPSVKIRIPNKKYNQQLSNILHSNISNIIITDEYQPEIKRYGGKQNIDYIERLFCLSSKLTATYFCKEKIELRILLAIKLNNFLFEKIKLNNNQRTTLFSLLSEIWEDYTKENLNFYIGDINYLAKMLKKRMNIYKLNLPSDIYNEYVSNLSCLDNLLFEDYNQENPKYSNDLKYFIINSGINKPLLNIIISLAHMNFNRLGIFPHVECTIYKMLSNNY
ncbi:thiopeptide-type bacteriocin biosynthesis domain protein [Heyndrickxia coagulans]|uniref:Thiopeptide-type bacteriocin biosynthesis domain protein n=1 Tax=Heyndrickxia coagulans TaxID=1398 RepID=A0A133KAS9_HEYCO|nr:thiopeptide-type bacteriocin biosynthesis domain protein [Heyndrickxia coagulans]KYC63182.1 hypothetical protein B4100_0342 [Heyndrickxia coagulans]